MRGDAGGHRHVQHDQVGVTCHVSRVSCPHVSRVRLWSRPVPCPLQGPHAVAYGRGGARELCGHPPSLMDRCADLISNTTATKYRAAATRTTACCSSPTRPVPTFRGPRAEVGAFDNYNNESRRRSIGFHKHGEAPILLLGHSPG